MIDLSDVLVFAGLVLLGVMVYHIGGLYILIGFIGGCVLALGLVLAWRQARGKPVR